MSSLSPSPPLRRFGIPMMWWPVLISAVVFAMVVAWGVPPVLIGLLAVSGIASLTLANEISRRRRSILSRSAAESCDAELQSWKSKWRALHAETRQNASALLQLTDGVVVLAADDSILLINPSAVHLLSLEKRDTLLGRRFTEVVRVPSLTAAIHTAVEERQPQQSVVEMRHPGGIRFLRIRVDLIDTGEDHHLQLSLHDETEHRRLENLRRDFIANVSHELKTPLAAIKGYAETVELAIQDDPVAATHFMSQIRSQCLRLERLIADMMQLARAQAGRDKLNLASVPLADVIAESIRTYQPVAVASGLQLTVSAIDKKAKVIADREATLTIANNLIGNAIRYTPRGGCVTVSLSMNEEHGGGWCFAVQDTGIGIAPEEQSRIFERFYRAGRHSDVDGGGGAGTGLGLAIVKNLAQAQNGHVGLQSTPGQGSTFWVTLPAVPQRQSNATS